MKTFIKHSILFGAIIFMISSCKKSLELSPTYQLTTSNAFPDLDAYNKQLNAIYLDFAGGDYYNGSFGADADILTDNLYETIETFAGLQKVGNWEYAANEGFMANAWLKPYNTIFQANVIVNGIEEKKSENEKKYNRILGQALAARAIAHFDLLKAFANNLGRNSTDPGVTIKTTTEITFPARNSVKEVYDFIYNDLNKAVTLLSNVDVAINTSTNKAYLDIWGVKAALARIALYAKDYALAITNATE